MAEDSLVDFFEKGGAGNIFTFVKRGPPRKNDVLHRYVRKLGWFLTPIVVRMSVWGGESCTLEIDFGKHS